MRGRRTADCPKHLEAMEQTELDEVARNLREAVAASPTCNAELDAWYKRSTDILNDLRARFPDFELPHEVMLYFADGDIRAKDVDYRMSQNAEILDTVARLERGSPG